jgi:hypothetical protein
MRVERDYESIADASIVLDSNDVEHAKFDAWFANRGQRIVAISEEVAKKPEMVSVYTCSSERKLGRSTAPGQRQRYSPASLIYVL